jgi:hypothetical protein
MASPGAARWQHMPDGLRAFRHRNFRLFFSGQCVSLIGTWMQQVAQGWLVLQLTNDPLALGFVSVAQFLPVMILGLFGGIAADALPKRTGLLITQSSSAVLALVLGLLVLTGHVQVWQVIVLAALLGTVNAFDMPIRQSFAVEMVGRDDVVSAVALSSAVFNGARIVGPAVAGVLIALIGLAPCFLLNAASYVAVIVGLLLMRSDELLTPVRARLERSVHAVLASLAEGLRYVRSTPSILLAVTMVGVVSTVAFNFQVLMPLAARDLLGGGAATYGFLMAASGIGSLISAISMAFGGRPTLGRLLAGAGAVGVTILAMGLSTSMPLSLLLMGIVGWGLIAMASTTNMIIQLSVPDVLRGRVMSVYTTVFAGTTPIGALFAGGLAATAGVAIALVLGGLLAIVATVGGVIWVARNDRLSMSAEPGLGPLDVAQGAGR